MRNFLITSLQVVALVATTVKARSNDSLVLLKSYDFPVYYSPGHLERAENIAPRIKNAVSFHQALLDFRPSVTLMVLGPGDWDKYATKGAVYGMPHYNEKENKLIVAAEDNPFWKSFMPPLDVLPEELAKNIRATYRNSEGQLSMQAFFDLLAIHELGHAFHMQGDLTMQRPWLGELFVNIFLHTYIAEREPELLPALTIFPRMVLAGGTKEFTYTSLGDITQRYDEIAMKYPKNYGWYQCRWHYAAATIYEAGGKQVLRKLWDALKNNKELLNDQQLLRFLQTMTGKSIADVMEYWDRDTNR